MALIYFLNVDSNKTQKLCATASPDLPDPQQTAVPVRTTRGRAAKRDVAGQFVCIGVHVHVHFGMTCSSGFNLLSQCRLKQDSEAMCYCISRLT